MRASTLQLKNIFLTILVASFLVLGLGFTLLAPHTAEAQPGPPAPPGTPGAPGGGSSGGGGPSLPPAIPSPPVAGAGGSGDTTVGAGDDMNAVQQCSIMDGMTSVNFDCLASIIAQALLDLAGVFVSLAGVALNWALVKTVMGMGTLVNEMTGITVAWTVLRDLANLVFIFTLVFISIATILRVERYGYKQLLKNLIIVALLINFSLVITKVVIDTSNLFATAIYSNIVFQSGGTGADCSITFQGQPANEECLSQGISGIFMNLTRISTLYDTDGGVGTELGFGTILLVGVFGSIFLLITAFIFLSAAILLVIRFVTLIILMIFSPIAFAAYILPQTQGYASMWWKKLLQQSFFAPIYLLMIWITIVLMISMSSIVGDDTSSFASALTTPDTAFKDIILNFIIISAFMIASLVIAKNMGAYGAGRIQGIGVGAARATGRFAGRTTRRVAGAATLGTAGYVGRRTLGKWGNMAANSERLKNAEAKGGVKGFMARQAMRTGNKAASSTFDARNTGVGKKVGLTGSATTHNKAREERAKAMKERAKQLESVRYNKQERASLQENERVVVAYETKKQKMKEAERRGDTTLANQLEQELASQQVTYTEAAKKVNDLKTTAIERGKRRKEEFTNSLDRDASSGWSGQFAFNTRDGSQDAVDELRKGKTNYDKLLEELQKDIKEKGELGGSPTPPSNSTPPSSSTN